MVGLEFTSVRSAFRGRSERRSGDAARRGVASLLMTYLRPQIWSVGALIACLLAAVGLQLIAPQMISRFIDLVVTRGAKAPLSALEGFALLFIVANFAAQGFRVAGGYFSAALGWTATNQLRFDLAAHCLALDMEFHTKRTAGELIERIDGDVSVMTVVFSQFAFQILGSGLTIAGILLVLFALNVWVGSALTVFAAASLLILQRTRQMGVPLYTRERQVRADLSAFIEERLDGLDDIRANAGGDHVMARLNALNTELTGQGVRAVKTAAVFFVVITNAVFMTGFVVALGLGVLLFQSGRATLGEIYLLVQYTTLLRQPLERIGTEFQGLQRALAGLGRVTELQALPVVIRDGPGVDWTSRAPSVAFEGVRFAYDGGPPVLHDISFDLAPGETLGLLGRTGIGKTTITRLLTRLYDPTAGAIRLDGRDVRDATLAQLRTHVGVVTQDVQLFHADIRANLTLFDPALPDMSLIRALQDLGLGPWLERQDNGLDTVLHAGGDQLSAGEAQLLAFARVFLKDPGLIVLDEASSRLDGASEQLIQQTLANLLGRGPGGGRPRTAIIVAHRLATVRQVDKVMILDHGRIAEFGPREALEADPTSRFARLLRSDFTEAAE
jgi:ABC-type multidrug transport system fused ATPase/permease subunit